MSVRFSGWRVKDSEHSFHHGELNPDQTANNGGSYTIYHGTSVATVWLIIANGFQQSEDGLLGKGVYVTRDIIKACLYPKSSKSSDCVVWKLSVSSVSARITIPCWPLGAIMVIMPPGCRLVAGWKLCPATYRRIVCLTREGWRHCKGAHRRHRGRAFASSG